MKMKAIRIMLSMLLAVVTCSSLAQGVIVYKSNGTQEKIPYVALDSIILYYADQEPVPIVEAKAVDLGLPSGTLWASHNVGATAPEQLGGYYAYGETEEKATYSWDSYMCTSQSACGTSSDPLYADGILTYDQVGTFTYNKSCNIAGTKYDVATQTWGESWVMPTKQQYSELINNCTISTVTINDLLCLEVTGPNGNSVIFPLDGGYKENANLVGVNNYEHYTSFWIADMSYQLYYADEARARNNGIGHYSSMTYRYLGMQVRPVKKQ